MSVSRRRDKVYTGPNGVPEDRLRADDKLRKSPTGLHERHAAHSPQAVRAYLDAGQCPFCGKGFKNMGGHTNRSHGVSAAELREMAGMLKGERICSPELSEACRARGKKVGMPEAARLAPRKKRSFSTAGLETQRAKLDLARANHPGGSSGHAAMARAAAIAKVRSQNKQKYAMILRLYGEGRLIKDIAAEVGVSLPTVHDTLRRNGVDDDLKRRRGALMTPADRQATADRLKASFRDAMGRERDALLQEFQREGSTYAAVHLLAKRHGTSAKSMADRLRKAGAPVPDGRLEANTSRFSDADRSRMCEMYAAGSSQTQIARTFGIGQPYVSQILRDAGVNTRPFVHSGGTS